MNNTNILEIVKVRNWNKNELENLSNIPKKAIVKNPNGSIEIVNRKYFVKDYRDADYNKSVYMRILLIREFCKKKNHIKENIKFLKPIENENENSLEKRLRLFQMFIDNRK